MRTGACGAPVPRHASRCPAHTSSSDTLQLQFHPTLRVARRGRSSVETRGWRGCGGESSADVPAGTARDFGRAPRSRRARGASRGCRRDEPLLEQSIRSAPSRQGKSIGAGWAGVPRPRGERALGLERGGTGGAVPRTVGGVRGVSLSDPHPHAARWEATTLSHSIEYNMVISLPRTVRLCWGTSDRSRRPAARRYPESCGR